MRRQLAGGRRRRIYDHHHSSGANTTTSCNKYPPRIVLIIFILLSVLLQKNYLWSLYYSYDRTSVPHIRSKLPNCLRPNRTKTEALVSSIRTNPTIRDWKVINLGMPKMGSTSLYQFFQCANITANHWRIADETFLGICMMQNAVVDNNMIHTCSYGAQALTQIDVALDSSRCFFPQLDRLEQLVGTPQTLYILVFRNIEQWMTSLQSQVRSDGSSLYQRMGYCTELHHTNPHDFLCRHVETVRRLQPEHLLELDLEDTQWTGTMLANLYQVPKTCWRKTNARQRTSWLGVR